MNSFFSGPEWEEFLRLIKRLQAATDTEQKRIIAGIKKPRFLRMLDLWKLECMKATPPQPGLRLRDNLTLEKLLGRGGMGRVYEAERTLGSHVQKVAVKFLNPELLHPGGRVAATAIQKFWDEVRRLRDLQHPYIVTLLDAGEVETAPGAPAVPWLAMDLLGDNVPLVLVPGIPGDPKLYGQILGSVENKLLVFERLLEAMAYAHRQNVLHLDLSPNNVRVVGGPEPRVIDLGLSDVRNVFRPGSDHRMHAGTPGYQAPEVLHGALGEVGTWTDVHVLGVLGYHLFVGELPYVIPQGLSNGVDAINAGVQSKERVPFAGRLRNRVSDRDALLRFAPVLDMACKRDPRERYHSAADFLAAWKQAKEQEPPRPGHGRAPRPDGGPVAPAAPGNSGVYVGGGIHGAPGSITQLAGEKGRNIVVQSHNTDSFNNAKDSFHHTTNVTASDGGIAVGGNVSRSRLSTHKSTHKKTGRRAGPA